MTALKGITPTPAQAAAAYKQTFGDVIDAAAGKDGRISRAEAARVALRGDAGALVADNLVHYLEKTGQKSVSAHKFKNVVADYVAATASNAAGSNQKLSLLEIRNMPDDLQSDIKHLRGKDKLEMSPHINFNENFLYDYMVTKDLWRPTRTVAAGSVAQSGNDIVFNGLTDVGEWQGVAEHALASIWNNVLVHRSWPVGDPVDIARNRAGILEMGECVDQDTGRSGLLVKWADIDDASFAWFYEKKADGSFKRRKEVFLN